MRLVARQVNRAWQGWVGPLALLVAAACSPVTPAPGPQDLVAPKQLATVPVSPTPVETRVVPPTTTRQPTATPSLPPPTPIPSPTPYAGIFMGDGSAPIVLPTAPVAALVEVTLIPATPLGGPGAPAFPTSTPISILPGGTQIASVPVEGCATQPAALFSGPYAANPRVGQAIGCPIAAPEQLAMAEQPFEHGSMFWVSSGQIFGLASQVVDGQNNVFWQAADTWQEGMPADDPQMTVPEGLIQPIRGFGLAWRSNLTLRSALGYATTQEEGYTGTLQRFERGLMLSTRQGAVYALAPDASATRGQYIGPLF